MHGTQTEQEKNPRVRERERRKPSISALALGPVVAEAEGGVCLVGGRGEGGHSWLDFSLEKLRVLNLKESEASEEWMDGWIGGCLCFFGCLFLDDDVCAMIVVCENERNGKRWRERMAGDLYVCTWELTSAKTPSLASKPRVAN